MIKRVLVASTALFLFFVQAPEVKAAPLVGAIPLLFTGATAAGGLSIGGVLLGIAGAGAQWLISKMLTPEPKQRGIKDRVDIGGDNPPRVVFGEYATHGQLVYRNSLDGGSNIPEACLVDVICLGVLPYEAVSNRVFINNERCTINTSSSWEGGFMQVDEYVKGGDDGGYCLMKFHTGDQANSDNWLMQKFGNDPDRPWKNSMFLPGCTYAIVQSWYSNRGIWSGSPNFRFVVRGAKFYDPRKDSTVGGSGAHRWGNQNTWTFTKNPKVIQYNVIRGIRYNGKHMWGGKAEAYRLPLEYWFAAMNRCDEPFTKKNGEVIKRYEVGGEFSLDERPIELINELDKCCDGYTTEYGGTYKTWVGGPGLSVASITDDDFIITADVETIPFESQQKTYNTCYMTYPEPSQQWEVKDAPRFQDADALAEDGEELSFELPLPFVSETNQVQRLGRSATKDSRRQVTHAGQLPPIAWMYEPFDRLTYFSVEHGYAGNGKDFIIASQEDLPNVNQFVLLREINPNDQGYLPEYELDSDAAPLVVVRPGDLDLPIEASADVVETSAGKDKPAIRGEWDWAGDGDIDVQYVDWRIRRTGTTKVIAEGKFKKVLDGFGLATSSVLRFGAQYDIQFEPKPFSNRASVPTAWQSVTMLPVDVPGAPDLTVISVMGADKKLDYFVQADWAQVDQRNDGYRVRVTIDGRTRTYTSPDNQHTFAVSAPSEVSVAIATKATESTRSAFGPAATKSVTKRSANSAIVTGLKKRRVPKGIRTWWDASTHDYHDQFGIYASETDDFEDAVFLDFTPATTYLDDRPRARKKRMWYWVFSFDKVGNRGERAAPVDEEYTLIESDDIDPDFKEDITAEIEAKVQIVTDQVSADLAAMTEAYDAAIAAINAELAGIGGGAGGTAAQAMVRIRELGEKFKALAAQASNQGLVHFTQKEELKAEVADNRATFTEQIELIVTSALAIAERTTTLEAETENLDSSLETFETAVAGEFETLAGQITFLNSIMEGKAEASAVETLTTQVYEVDGKVTSLAEAITEVNAGSISGDLASVRVRMAAQGSVPAGYNARYAIETRAAKGQSFSVAGFYMDVANNGTSRVVIDAGKFVVMNGAGATAPFIVSGGAVYLQNVYTNAAYITGQLSASQISVGSLAALSGTLGSVNIGSAIMGSLTVGTLNIAGNAVSVSAWAEGPGSLSVAANAETTLASLFQSWGSTSPQAFRIGYQYRCVENMNFRLRIYLNGSNVTPGSSGYIAMRAPTDAINSAFEVLTSVGAGLSGGTFSITLQREESGVPASPVRNCKIAVETMKR